MIDYKKNLLFILVFISGFILFTVYSYTAEKMIYNETCTANWVIFNDQGRANLTIDFMYNKKNKTGTVALSGTWQQGNRESKSIGNDSNLLIVFYVQIMPDDFVMQLHR
ncbi:hypothetical protein N6O39_16215, partial [Escherichia coli]|nr:hypothetical protein [Escherichia coli]